MKRFHVMIIGGVVAAFLLLIAIMVLVEITTVSGNEVGVKETWTSGVVTETYAPKTYFLFPGYSQTMYRYDMSPQIYVMNDRVDDERANGRKHDAYEAKSSDNQAMKMWLALQWKYDATKLIGIHKTYRTHAGMRNWDDIIEERLIRQNLMSAVNTESTKHKAIDAYSGDGFVALQQAIADRLQDPNGELRTQGIIVDTFVIEKIELDAAYIGEINKRQVAQQRELRARQEELAALAEAQKVKAEAQSDYEKQIVEANREKQKVVLASEAAAAQQINEAKAAAERQVLAAKADAEKVVLAANAEKAAGEARASAIKAIGDAEAGATRAKLSAYAEKGADAYTRVEIAKQVAIAFGNVKGYLPEGMSVNLLSGQFQQAVESLLSGGQHSVPTGIAK